MIAIKNTERKTDKTLVISAHYDTTSNTRGVIDNGSGVATVLEIANILESYSLPFQIKFIFFGSEEYYLTGSKYYLSKLNDKERENMIGCINIDMIGDAELENVILGTKDGTENGLTLRLLNAHKENSILKTWQSIGTSDDVSFDRWNIPSILVSDRQVNPKWIRKEAPISAIDTKRLEEIVNVLCSMIISIDINKEFKNYKGQINEDGISPLYKNEDIMNNCVPGYKLVNSEEILLENELGSQLCYLFENNKKENYKIIQQYENPFIEQFRKSSKDYLLIKEGNRYRLVIANNGDHYITQIIGTMNQIRYLSKLWDIKI